MTTTPDHLDQALNIHVENMDALITELESVVERHLAESLVTAHGILGALEDVKQRYWHRLNDIREQDDTEEQEQTS